MTTGMIVALIMVALIAVQFFFPTALSALTSGAAYGAVKAVLDTWSANRKERKKARAERRAANGGLFGRRRRASSQVDQPATQAEPETKPIPPDEKNAMGALGFDQYIDGFKPLPNPYDTAFSARQQRRLERRARRRRGGR